ncbi:MAG TPA: hypothetical protein VJ691_16570 [Vicinamibacterales bacterium]|nr:hypothetical protein [Vicinamibacterales bacterium]
MQHFSDADWADFVRGISIPDEAEMKAHLGACPECGELVSALHQVAEVYLRDAVATPPDHVLHPARAIFEMWTPDRVRLFSPSTARLVFDSFASPALAGIRSGQPMYRQLLYESDPYAIDLRLDGQRGEHRVLLTGQVASADPQRAVGGVRVILTADGGRRVVEEIHTNDAGEFHLEYEPAPHLHLRVEVDSRPHIELPPDHGADGNGDFGED